LFVRPSSHTLLVNSHSVSLSVFPFTFRPPLRSTLFPYTTLFRSELGLWFVALFAALNLLWFYFSVNQFKRITDYNRYAGRIFVFSLNYVVIFFVMVIVAGLLVNV